MMATPTGKLRGPQGPTLNPLSGQCAEVDTLFTVDRVFFSWTVMEIPWPGRILVEFSKRLRARPSTGFTVVKLPSAVQYPVIEIEVPIGKVTVWLPMSTCTTAVSLFGRKW